MYRYPGQRKLNLSAAELNRMTDAANKASFNREGVRELSLPDDQQSHWVWLRNDSGSDRARFDCMSLGDPLFEMLDDGTVDLLFKGLTAAADKTPAILLEPIANGAMGKAVIHGLALAKVGGGSTSELTATPDATNHRLTPGGDIKLLAAPHASAVKLLPVLLGVGGGSSPAIPRIFRMKIMGRNSANAIEWDDSFGSNNGWIHYTPGSSNILSPELGVTAVADTAGGAPADAEVLQFANPGDYRIVISYQVGVHPTTLRALMSGCNVNQIGSGALGDFGARRFSNSPTASLSPSLAPMTFVDVRVIRTTVANQLMRVSIWAVKGTGFPPLAEGSVSVERCA